MKQVTIYCDGSGTVAGNPCGFAAILQCGKVEREITGSLPDGTNNVAELMAATIGLEALQEPCQVTVWSDSQYVVKGMTFGWHHKWARNGWKRQEEGSDEWKPVANAEYWKRLLAAAAPHGVIFKHVKGHNGHPINERCHRLAVAARKKAGYKPTPPAYDAQGNRVAA